MHILFAHRNHPAQFGHIAERLAARPGWKVTFASAGGSRYGTGIDGVPYTLKGGAHAGTQFCAATFENLMWHSQAMHEALAARPEIVPDLVVGHSGFVSTLFLRDLYRCPHINYFEYFYSVASSDMDFRPDVPVETREKHRAWARNAGFLLDLDQCDAGYTPTRWQHGRLPVAFRDKVRVVFDGIDTEIWTPGPKAPRQAGRFPFADDVKLVTYAARGLESMRGFDAFMEFARHLSRRRADVRFIVIGEDRTFYGNDDQRTGGLTFKQWVLKNGDYDLTKFAFLGAVPPDVLARIFQFTDLYVYLTAPFVLSWSLFNAMACGSVVLGSDTAPVREVIEPGRNGLLHDFFDPEGMAERAYRILGDPAGHAPLGAAAAETIRARYSLDVCLPQLERLFTETASRPTGFRF